MTRRGGKLFVYDTYTDPDNIEALPAEEASVKACSIRAYNFHVFARALPAMLKISFNVVAFKFTSTPTLTQTPTHPRSVMASQQEP